MTLKPITLLTALLLAQGCSSSDDLNIVDQGDKEDVVGAIATDPGYVMFLLPCSAKTGCRSTTILDFDQLGAEAGEVTVSIGRTQAELREVGTAPVNGKGEFILEINELADASIVSETSLGYDPSEKLIVMVELNNDNPVSYQMSNCIRDILPPEGVNPLILHSPYTLHDSADTDVFSFDVVDDFNLDTSNLTGNIIEIDRVAVGADLSAKSVTEAVYTCKSDGEEIPFELTRDRDGSYSLGLDPDCNGTDDSGTVTVKVNDPEADARSCPTYYLYAEVQASHL